MKKRFPAFFLALALCVGLVVPAFAADTKSITAAGITFETMVTDRYESWKSSSEGFSWAAGAGAEAEFEYSVGRINFGPENGVSSFWAYLVDDDVTLDFHVKNGDKFYMEGYYLSVGDPEILGEDAYAATCIGGGTFTAWEDDLVVDRALIDKYFPGANYVYCYRGAYASNITFDETINVVFADEDAVPRTVPGFTDLLPWCDAEALWASWKNITNGYGGKTTFAPGKDCTQAQILTFLWRAKDRPEAAQAPITAAASYQNAINWAYEKKMIDGSFNPDAPCTRSQAMMFIWQAFSEPEVEKAASFSDVDADAPYAQAVSWAVEKGVTKGYGGSDTFAPNRVCSRGEIVTFLFRAFTTN